MFLSGSVPSFLDNLVYFPVSIKKKTEEKKRNGKGGRLRKKFQVSDSDSDETSARADDSSNEDSVQVLNSDNDHKIPKVLSSENPLPSRVTRSKARSSTLENGEPSAKCDKTPESSTHTRNDLDKRLESFTLYRLALVLISVITIYKPNM